MWTLGDTLSLTRTYCMVEPEIPELVVSLSTEDAFVIAKDRKLAGPAGLGRDTVFRMGGTLPMLRGFEKRGRRYLLYMESGSLKISLGNAAGDG